MITILDYKTIFESRKAQIADRLRTLRKTNGYTQLQLADTLGYSEPTIKKWEKRGGENSIPTMEQLYNLATLYNCETNYLLCEIDCKTQITTDICAETGLSEKAAHILSDIQRKENLRFKHNEPNFNPAKFISHFIENSEEIIRYIHTLWGYSALLNGQKDEFWGLVVDAYNNAITYSYSEEGFIELLKDKIKNSQLFADLKKVYPAITVESIAKSHRTSFRLLDKDENLQEFCISNEFLKIVKSFGTIQDSKGGSHNGNKDQ